MGRTAFLVLKMPIYNHVLRPCDCVEPNKPPTHWRGKKYSRHPLTSFNINKMAENESQPSSSGENIPCRNSFSENSPTDHIHQALIVSYIVIILPPICSHACLYSNTRSRSSIPASRILPWGTSLPEIHGFLYQNPIRSIRLSSCFFFPSKSSNFGIRID